MKKYLIVLVVLILVAPSISLADVLGVTGITAVKTSAMANGNYADGWSWIFNVHIPANESANTTLKLKFGDWSNGSASIPVANNIRVYSASALNASTSDSAITINSANTYSDALILADESTGDLGRDIQVTMEARVPTGTTGGNYSTSYGVLSDGTTTPIVHEVLPVADLAVSLSPVSPLTETISYKTNVPLAIYRFTSTKQDSLLESLTFAFQTDPDLGQDLFSNLKNISLSDGVNNWYYSATGTDSVRFDNLMIPLTKDIYKDLTLKADISATTTVYTVTPSLKTSQISATDANYEIPTINGASSPYSTTTDIVGYPATFINSPL